MSTEAVEQVERRPMSFEDYLALPEKPKAEYVDGVALMPPPSTAGHSITARRIANSLDARIPDATVVTEAGIRITPSRVRIPDVAVFAQFEDVSIGTQTPLLVVEVLSPSTRTEDTVRKVDEYRRAGVPQYWIVDRGNHTLTALVNAGEAWEVVLELTEAHPTGAVEVAGKPVDLDLSAHLR